MLGAEFAQEREARGCEEHFLAHGCGVGDIGDGDEGLVGRGQRICAAEEDVEGGIGLDVGLEVREVGIESG